MQTQSAKCVVVGDGAVGSCPPFSPILVFILSFSLFVAFVLLFIYFFFSRTHSSFFFFFFFFFF